MSVPSRQIPGVYRRRIGDIVVTAISDGYLDASYDFMRNITPPDAERILKEAYRPAPPRISVNTFLIHSGGRIALVDTGSQHSMGPTLGHMPKHIAAAGVDVTDIDTIILTHMHPDHSNGLTDANGKATGKDGAVGKGTFVSVLGVDQAKARLKALVGEAEDALAPFGRDGDILKMAARFVAERKA